MVISLIITGGLAFLSKDFLRGIKEVSKKLSIFKDPFLRPKKISSAKNPTSLSLQISHRSSRPSRLPLINYRPRGFNSDIHFPKILGSSIIAAIGAGIRCHCPRNFVLSHRDPRNC
jgi:hypothetical protein